MSDDKTRDAFFMERMKRGYERIRNAPFEIEPTRIFVSNKTYEKIISGEIACPCCGYKVGEESGK